MNNKQKIVDFETFKNNKDYKITKGLVEGVFEILPDYISNKIEIFIHTMVIGKENIEYLKMIENTMCMDDILRILTATCLSKLGVHIDHLVSLIMKPDFMKELDRISNDILEQMLNNIYDVDFGDLGK